MNFLWYIYFFHYFWNIEIFLFLLDYIFMHSSNKKIDNFLLYFKKIIIIIILNQYHLIKRKKL